MHCLNDEQLEAIARGASGDALSEEARTHVAACAGCRERLAELQAEAELANELRQLAQVTQTQDASDAAPFRAGAAASTPRFRGVELPGYEILREVSFGGQGVVFEAVQLSTKRKVAIKILLDGPYSSPAARRRFQREVELCAQLKHPNIVAIFDSGEMADGRQFYVMDYVAGVPLSRYIRDNRPPLEESLDLFIRICDAVQYAHRRGVIHRDLKPGNILVDEEGQPRVLDFGLAKAADTPGETQISVTGQILGTLPYMSPEQASGTNEDVDTRTDVYALGVILYEMLTGQFPYPVVGQVADVLRNIAEAQPTPPSRAWNDQAGVGPRSTGRVRQGECPIDDDVQTIVLKALAKEPQRRYQSAGEVAADILRYLEGDAIEAKRDSSWYVLRRMAARHVLATTMIVSLLVSVLSFGSISFYLWRQADEANKVRTDAEDLVRQQNQELAWHRHDALASLTSTARRMSLGWFLLEWHAGRGERARSIHAKLPPNSAEERVMAYLMDESFSFERLQKELPADASALAHFARAERLFKAGDPAGAIEAYQLCADQARGDGLSDAALARLNQLQDAKGGGG